jgi:hypothetical protein
MPDRLVIVVPYSEEQATRSRIMGLATSGWEQHVQLVGGPDRRGPGDSARIESKRILEIVDKFDADVLIVTKEICCDSRTIQARQKIDLRRPPIWLLRDQLITRELRSGDCTGVRSLRNVWHIGTPKRTTPTTGCVNSARHIG